MIHESSSAISNKCLQLEREVAELKRLYEQLKCVLAKRESLLDRWNEKLDSARFQIATLTKSMADELERIPEDLRKRWAELNTWVRGPVTEITEMPNEIGRLSELMLIERIADLQAKLEEKERNDIQSGTSKVDDRNEANHQTNRQVHEEAAGMGLCDEFFTLNKIAPDDAFSDAASRIESKEAQ